jgi:hypothetical protein
VLLDRSGDEAIDRRCQRLRHGAFVERVGVPLRTFCGHDLRGVGIPANKKPPFPAAFLVAVLGSNQ